MLACMGVAALVTPLVEGLVARQMIADMTAIVTGMVASMMDQYFQCKFSHDDNWKGLNFFYNLISLLMMKSSFLRVAFCSSM